MPERSPVDRITRRDLLKGLAATAVGTVAQSLAVAAGTTNTQVNVTTNIDATPPEPEPDTSFHLQVIC